jgi:hypothetical protein
MIYFLVWMFNVGRERTAAFDWMSASLANARQGVRKSVAFAIPAHATRWRLTFHFPQRVDDVLLRNSRFLHCPFSGAKHQ